MKAVEDIGAAENTNLVLVSDHGQRNITKIVNINVALKEHGLIRVDENGEFRDWDAWCLSGGMSAEVHLRHPEDLELYSRVKQLLETIWNRTDFYEGRSRKRTSGRNIFLYSGSTGWSFLRR